MVLVTTLTMTVYGLRNLQREPTSRRACTLCCTVTETERRLASIAVVEREGRRVERREQVLLGARATDVRHTLVYFVCGRAMPLVALLEHWEKEYASVLRGAEVSMGNL